MEKRESILGNDPEKMKDASTSSFDLSEKDEALRLVGLERSETFTQEQYLKVRRKLVCRGHSPYLGAKAYTT
jgi:MFS transporter, ACS family, allantoate permease